MSQPRYERRIKLAAWSNAPFGVGSWHPKAILIIGEQAAKPELNSNQQPFCSANGCSGWLNNQLDMHDIPEEGLFWVNALNNDGTKIDLKKLSKDLDPLVTFALGGVAQRLCDEQGIVKMVKIPHPQYWRRFRSREEYPLIQWVLAAQRIQRIIYKDLWCG